MDSSDPSALLEELAVLLPPPPVAIVSPPWDESMVRVGFVFPSDYQAFIARYGFGSWSSEGEAVEVAIFGPDLVDTSPEPIGFERFVADQAVSYALPTDDPDYEYVPFPEPGSMLTFGGTEENDRLMWHVTGPDSDLWPVILCGEGHDGSMYRFDGGMLAFLVALMRGEFELADVFVGRRPVWTVYRDWSSVIRASGGPAVAKPGWL